MRAAWYERKGPAREVMRSGELPDPSPGSGEVRVRLRFSGVNPSDTKGRSGWGGDATMPAPRVVPHQDGAGTVDRVGEGVPETRLGERVWVYEAQRDGRAFGTAAEYAVVPARNAVPVPDGAGFELGASLGVPAMTAHRCLFIDGPVEGRSVLVQGGAGAVGHMAVQLAKWGGAAAVIATAGGARADLARRAGADHVVDHRAEDVAERVLALTGGAGVDRIVEVAFEANLPVTRRVLRANGVVSTYASGGADSAPRLPFYEMLLKGLTVHFVYVYAMPRAAHDAAARDIDAAIAAGRLRANVARTFPLDGVAEAHDLLDSGEAGGKLLVDCGP